VCFGPTASFSSGALLAVVGAATIAQVRTPRHLLFASFPILFSVHQVIEGFLWIELKTPNAYLQPILTFGYLFMALCLWPILSPLGIYLMEENSLRRRLMLPLVLLGSFVGLYLFSNLLSGTWSATVENCSIYYDFKLRQSEVLFTVLYLAAVFGTALLSARRSTVIIGAINILACGLAAAVYYREFISIWCFFAAFFSAMIYFFFKSLCGVPRTLPIRKTEANLNPVRALK
jgi:hypothetical protein